MEIQMTITVTPEQAERIAKFLRGTPDLESNSAKEFAQNAEPLQTAPIKQNTPAQQQAASAQAIPKQQFSVPVQQAQPTQQIVPTGSPVYTIGQLQTAIAPLLDAGKVAQIQQLVQSFGVATLMDIPQERYGEFANGLRALGGVL